MGLASSQARLLNLTSRMHQIEYKAAKVEAEKLQMANESDRVYNEYLDALEATKVQHKKLNPNGSVTYIDFTGYSGGADTFTGAGFAFCRGTTVYDGSAGHTLDDLCIALHIIDSGSVSFSNELLTNIINSGEVIIVTHVPGTTSFPSTEEEITLSQTSVATNTNLQEVQDETMLRIAEAKYEADMRKIDKKERKYDAELATFDNERNAIKQEIDTLKTVAKENVDRTFKIFS